jgi:hypothetical protein
MLRVDERLAFARALVRASAHIPGRSTALSLPHLRQPLLGREPSPTASLAVGAGTSTHNRETSALATITCHIDGEPRVTVADVRMMP